jgi:peptidylprolyl isomerase
VVIALRPDLAPNHVKRIKELARARFYDGIVFHRVIDGFMAQTGDPTGTGAGGESIWKKPFKDEFKSGVIFDKPGILAMANAGPRTNGSQFFITTAPTPWLNGYHTIFGRVVSGMDTLGKLNNVQTSGPRSGDRPVQTQKIIKATLLP